MENRRIGVLPTGLELWFGEDGAYTIPRRAGVYDVQRTFEEVEAWARAGHLPNPATVANWLDVFEDQYPYLSKTMPKRQERESLGAWAKEIDAVLFKKQ